MANQVRFLDQVSVSAFGNTGGTGTTSTGSLLLTASAATNVITFTKGDGSTFPVTVDTGSAVTISTGSLMTTASAALNVITFTKGDGTTFPITLDTGSTSISSSYATTSSFAQSGNGIFSGSFEGDGSQLTGIETDPFPYTGSAIISGSLEVHNITASGDISSSGDIIGKDFYVELGRIYGNKAYNNKLTFNASSSLFKIDNETYIKFDGSSGQNEVTVNEGTNDIDFVVKGASNNPLFKTVSSTNRIGTHGNGTPDADFHIGGDLKVDSHITASGNVSSSAASTASFGTYLGDGSGLTGVGADTGSLMTTASAALNVITFTKGDGSTFPITVDTGSGGGGGSGFPFSGSAVITGSLIVSGSGGDIVTVEGSGSNVFTVNGSLGQMFTVNDSFTGSLFGVGNISGLAPFEVFSDNTILWGDPAVLSLNTTVKRLCNTGNTVIYDNIPTSSYNSAFFEYTVVSASNARSGKITTVWIPGTANITSSEVTSPDIGSTTGFALTAIFTGSNVALTGSATTDGWVISSIVRGI